MCTPEETSGNRPLIEATSSGLSKPLCAVGPLYLPVPHPPIQSTQVDQWFGDSLDVKPTNIEG